MAVSNFTVRDIFSISTPAGPQRTTAGAAIESCIIDAIPTPNDGSQTYAQANDAQIATLHTLIAGFLRDGRTINTIQACFEALGDEAGSKAAAGACTISSNTLTFAVNGGDLTTEHANGALGVFNDGIKIRVTYTAT